MDTLKEDITEEYTVVGYTDGGAIPNPGFGGSGIHGFIYSNKNIEAKNTDTPPGGNVITEIGYMLKDMHRGTEHKLVKPTDYFNGIIPLGGGTTNNQAELYATIFLIREMLKIEHNVKHIIIKTDSEVTISVYSKVKQGVSISPSTKNLEYYNEIGVLLEEIKEKDISVRFIKVKAHTDESKDKNKIFHLGNVIADGLATTGVVASSNGIQEPVFKFNGEKNKYWKPTIRKHPFLRVRQIFFTHADERDSYAIMDYHKDVELGKKTNAALFGVVNINKENRETIDKIVEVDNDSKTAVLRYIDMGAYYNQHYLALKDIGDMIYTKKSKILKVTGMLPIVRQAYPQGTSKAIFDLTTSLRDNLEEFNKKEENPYIIDITDQFFKKNEKGKMICTLGTNDKTVKIKLNIDGKATKTVLTLGRELPDRNTIKGLEKYNPEMFIFLTKESSKAYRFKNIINLDTGEQAIYCNFFTSLILL